MTSCSSGGMVVSAGISTVVSSADMSTNSDPSVGAMTTEATPGFFTFFFFLGKVDCFNFLLLTELTLALLEALLLVCLCFLGSTSSLRPGSD